MRPGLIRSLLLILAILAFGASDADARRRGPRYRALEAIPAGALGAAPAQDMRAAGRYVGRNRSADRGRGSATLAELVPADWQPQPEDPNWRGKRYISPDGASWFALYATEVAPGRLGAAMKDVAFVEGEEITYLRGERNWIAVSGLNGARMFYRKAVLACSGKRLHNLAFEFPAADRRNIDEFIDRAAEAVQNSQNDNCEATASAF